MNTRGPRTPQNVLNGRYDAVLRLTGGVSFTDAEIAERRAAIEILRSAKTKGRRV